MRRPKKLNWPDGRVMWIALSLVFGAGLIAANAHLVLVAMQSQPACVKHDKVANHTTKEYRAAKSGC